MITKLPKGKIKTKDRGSKSGGLGERVSSTADWEEGEQRTDLSNFVFMLHMKCNHENVFIRYC